MTSIEIQRLTLDDWRAYRDLRLAALADAPYAFGSTLARELAFTEADWHARFVDRAQFAARIDDEVVGLIGCGLMPEKREIAELVSMWVHPDARGQGAGDALVRAVFEWAREQECDQVHLWVSEGNDPAERLYAQNGFIRSGEVQRISRADPNRLEFAMVCVLRGC
jgi:GNAT superfamily N-acetyltransferase